MQHIQGHRLQKRKFMAWRYSIKLPWEIEVAIETESLNAHLSGLTLISHHNRFPCFG
jgi:hypothetical protein